MEHKEDGGDLEQPLLHKGFDTAAETAGHQLALKPIKSVGLAWRGVSLSIPLKGKNNKGKTKEILKNISGTAPAGHVTAIMGPTGSGKSSLLNALAGRVSFIKGAKLEGELLVNGAPVAYGVVRRLCAYVVQDDVLYSFLTVHETLTLATHFYLPDSLSDGAKAAYVRDVINALGLAKAANTIIGDARVRGVSGGERKRVSVGVELICNPSLLFLDEPTSGLDSFQAQSVMSAMGSLARSGRTVVAAIHQPRSSIFDLLDMLVLVSEGRIVYSGKAREAVAYFSSQGLTCPPQFCPSDFFLDVISMDYRSPTLEKATRSRIEHLDRTWHERQAGEGGGEGGVLQAVGAGAGAMEIKGEEIEKGYQSSWARQFWMLLLRGLKQNRRNKFALVVKILSNAFFALILGAIYSKREGSTPGQTSIQNFVGALFFVAINQAFGNLQSVIQVFPLEKYIVQKERAAKAYHLSAYYFAKLLSELPFTLLGPLIFSSIAYWLVGLQPSLSPFLTFVCFCLLEATCAVSLGLVISAVAPDVPTATALSPAITIVFLLFSGVFINVKSLPTGAQWCPYMSFIKWSFNAYAQNQFKGMTFSCPDAEGKGCLTTGEEILALYSMDEYEVWQCGLALLGITTIFSILGYIILRMNSRKYMKMVGPSSASSGASAVPFFSSSAALNGEREVV
ncbi:hypothetical protein VYU27_005304 [Nannochloropsis oceanica]